MFKFNQKNGFTLIEVLIYSFLLSLIMVGILGSTYMIIESTSRSGEQLLTSDEANFILRKIDWILSGKYTIVSIASSELKVINSGKTYTLKQIGDDIVLETIAGSFPLDSSSIKASNLAFQYTPPDGGKPAAVKASFYLEDKFYETIKYIRK